MLPIIFCVTLSADCFGMAHADKDVLFIILLNML